MAKVTKVNEVFWLQSEDGKTLDVFVQFENGSEAQIADAATHGGETEEELGKLAKEIAWELGYEEFGDGKEGGSAASEPERRWMSAHDAWEEFLESHPNVLSETVAIANAVYYMRPNPGWEEHPNWFEGLCWVVWKVGEEKGASPQCVIDAAERLIEEGRLKTKWLGEDLVLVIDVLRVGVEEEKR